MHELGIMTSVLETAAQSAREAGASKLTGVTVTYGEMTEIIEDALRFAFDALKDQDPFTTDAVLMLHVVKPKSRCLECGVEYEHDRFHVCCPQCESALTTLIAGREMFIDSIEVEFPDEDAQETTEESKQGEEEGLPCTSI